jgi:TonB family protein
VLLLAGIIGFVVTRSKGPAAPTTVTTTAVTSTAPAATTTAGALTSTSTTTATTAAVPNSTSLATSDQALIDEEVQKRLAAEKARLEQQRLQQLAAQQKAATGTTQPVVPVATATQAQAPAPQPVAPPPTAPVAQSQPEPAQPAPAVSEPAASAPAVSRAKEGDMVEAGTDGLTAPAPLRGVSPNYPPAARARKLQGVVVVSAQVSETGKVLQARVLRGLNPDLGLNAAAVDAVRSLNFRPATKDGVRVKTYTTIAVNFKL